MAKKTLGTKRQGSRNTKKAGFAKGKPVQPDITEGCKTPGFGANEKPFIAVIFGGPSEERGISINSARTIYDHLSPFRKILPIYVDSSEVEHRAYLVDSKHLFSNTPDDFDHHLDNEKRLREEQTKHCSTADDFKALIPKESFGGVYLGCFSETEKEYDVLDRLLKSADVIFPAIHGTFGEDGKLQKYLDNLGCREKYVGANTATCKVVFDKYKAQEKLRKKNLDGVGCTQQLKLSFSPRKVENRPQKKTKGDESEPIEFKKFWLAKEFLKDLPGQLSGKRLGIELPGEILFHDLDRADFADKPKLYEFLRKAIHELKGKAIKNVENYLKFHDPVFKDKKNRKFFETNNKSLILKPQKSGSSLGVRQIVAGSRDIIEVAIEKVAELVVAGHGYDYVFENELKGTEFTSICIAKSCIGQTSEGSSLKGQRQRKDLVALIPTEIKKDGIFDNRKKYLPTNEVEFRCPPQFDGLKNAGEIVKKIQQGSQAVAKALGFRDFARLDGWVTNPENDEVEIVFTDFNPISGMDHSSILFQQAGAIGLSHAEVLAILLQPFDPELIKDVAQGSTLPLETVKPEYAADEVGDSQETTEVTVLFGGDTSEKEVSVLSGINVWLRLNAMRKHYMASPALCAKENGQWVIYHPTIETVLYNTSEDIIHACQSFSENLPARMRLINDVRKSIGFDEEYNPVVKPKQSLEDFLATEPLVFNVIHGGFGEDGTLQAMFESRGIAHTGSPSDVCSVCMDKSMTARAIGEFEIPNIHPLSQRVKDSFELRGLVDNEQERNSFWKELVVSLGSESIVAKPLNDGCSTGVVVLSSAEELYVYCEAMTSIGDTGREKEHLDGAKFDRHENSEKIKLPDITPETVLFEEFVETRSVEIDYGGVFVNTKKPVTPWVEITIAVYGGGSSISVLKPSITVSAGGVLSLEEKFQRGTGVNLTPPTMNILTDAEQANLRLNAIQGRDSAENDKLVIDAIDSSVDQVVLNVGKLAKALRLSGVARIDAFMNVHNGALRIIEVNTNPGLTAATVTFHQAAAAGSDLSPGNFLAKVLDLARRKRRLDTSNEAVESVDSEMEIDLDEERIAQEADDQLEKARSLLEGSCVSRGTAKDARVYPVFSLSDDQGQGTFHAQQIRAFNLIWALLVTNQIGDGRLEKRRSKIAVVGAGMAGVTAAAAAAMRGVEVDIFERTGHLMYLQRGNESRFIHPNLYDWPDQEANQDRTSLPCLNWEADVAGNVVKKIDEQWKWLVHHLPINPRFHHEVTDVRGGVDDKGCSTVQLSATGINFTDNYDAVILCTGFGIEKKLHLIDERSYWRDDSLHQEILERPIPRKILISGCGDGALIDILRLKLQNFNHRDFVDDILESSNLNPRDLKRKLKLADVAAYHAQLKPEDDVSDVLFNEYDKIENVKELVLKFTKKLRKDTDVVVNSRLRLPLALNASVLNRFAMFLLLKTENGVTYRPGNLDLSMVNLKKNGKGYRVRWNSDESPESFHSVIVRHGPRRPSPIHQLGPLKSAPRVPRYFQRKLKPKVLWRRSDRDVQRLGWKLKQAKVHSKYDEAFGVGTFFGCHKVPDANTCQAFGYTADLFRVPPHESQGIVREDDRLQGCPFVEHPFQLHLEERIWKHMREHCVFVKSSVHRRQFLRRQPEYETWIVLNAGLYEEDFKHILRNERVLFREIIDLGLKQPSSYLRAVDGKPSFEREVSTSLTSLVKLYAQKQKTVSSAAGHDFAKIASLFLDGRELRLSRIEAPTPSPLVRLIFSDDDWKKDKEESRSSNSPCDIRFVAWGIHHQKKKLPIFIPTPANRLRINVNSNGIFDFGSRQDKDESRKSDLALKNISIRSSGENSDSVRKTRLDMRNLSDDKPVESTTLKVDLGTYSPNLD